MVFSDIDIAMLNMTISLQRLCDVFFGKNKSTGWNYIWKYTYSTSIQSILSSLVSPISQSQIKMNKYFALFQIELSLHIFI